MAYKNCKFLIENDRYEYENMYEILDLFLLGGRITAEQYSELTGLLKRPENAITVDAIDR